MAGRSWHLVPQRTGRGVDEASAKGAEQVVQRLGTRQLPTRAGVAVDQVPRGLPRREGTGAAHADSPRRSTDESSASLD